MSAGGSFQRQHRYQLTDGRSGRIRIQPQVGSHQTGINRAWSEECLLVRSGGGTQDWSPAERRVMCRAANAPNQTARLRILRQSGITGRYRAHHINSAVRYPLLQGEPRNIEFLSQAEHHRAHARFAPRGRRGSAWRNQTRGRGYDRVRETASREAERMASQGRRAAPGSLQGVDRRAGIFGRLRAGVGREFRSTLRRGLSRAGHVVSRGLRVVNAVQTAHTLVTGSNRERAAEVGRVVGGVGGGRLGTAAGAALGGLIGSVIPVAGTAAGAFVGGLIGGVVGGWLGSSFGGQVAESAYDAFAGPEQLQLPHPRQHQELGGAGIREVSAGGILLRPTIDDIPAASFPPVISGFRFDPRAGGTVQFLGGDSKIRGIGSSITTEDLIVALICVYESNCLPAFSLDPADRANVKSGTKYKKVYYPESLRDTAIGDTLFETDFLMKTYSLGIICDDDQRGLFRKMSRPIVPELKNQFQLSSWSEKDSSESEWVRLWIEIGHIDVAIDPGSNIIRFGDVRMKVLTKRMRLDEDAPSGLSDVSESPSSSALQFAGLFTRHYDKIAQKVPAFARLKELAKLFYLAQWLRKRGVAVDVPWLRAMLAAKRIERRGDQHQDTIARLSVQEERRKQGQGRTTVMTRKMTGGVSLQLGENLLERMSASSSKMATRLPKDACPEISLTCFADSVTSNIERSIRTGGDVKSALDEVNLALLSLQQPTLYFLKARLLEMASVGTSKDLALCRYYGSSLTLLSEEGGGQTERDMFQESDSLLRKLIAENPLTDRFFGRLNFQLPKTFLPFSFERTSDDAPILDCCGFYDSSSVDADTFLDILLLECHPNVGLMQNLPKAPQEKISLSSNSLYLRHDLEGQPGLVCFQFRAVVDKMLHVLSGVTTILKEPIFDVCFKKILRTIQVSPLAAEAHRRPSELSSAWGALMPSSPDEGLLKQLDEVILLQAMEASKREFKEMKRRKSALQAHFQALSPKEASPSDDDLQRAIELSLRGVGASPHSLDDVDDERLHAAIAASLRGDVASLEHKDPELALAIALSRSEAPDDDDSEEEGELPEDQRIAEEDPALALAMAVSLSEAKHSEFLAEMSMLKEMGFSDASRNLAALRATSGNVQQALSQHLLAGAGI